MKEEWKKQGFIDEPVAEGTDLKAEIRKLCEQKNAIVLAHYYTRGEIQEVADFIGDSLALARKAADTDAKIIVMCGVHFMAETCKILSPDKLVLAPDLNAGCSLADSCKAEDLKKYKDEHPAALVLAHPECKGPVLACADVVGSTAVLLKYSTENPDKEYIVATEAGILHEMQRACPQTKFYPVPPEISEGGVGCSCNECDYMKMNTLLKIYNALRYEWPSVEVDPEVAREAVKPIERMLSI